MNSRTSTMAGRPGSAEPLAGIVFDLDGTLVDSRAHIVRYQRRLFRFVGVDFPDEHAVDFYTLDRLELERRYYRHMAPWRVEAFRRRYPYRRYLGEIRPLPGADWLLRRLAEQGVPLGLLTNRGTSTEPLLRRLGWRELFVTILPADGVERPKPDPEGLLLVARQWGVAPEEILFVGDSDLDEQCARAAGSQWLRIEAYEDAEATPRPGALLPLVRHLAQLGLLTP